MATVALLAGLFLSVAAGTRATSETVLCRAHLRHLGQAWQAYALDHSDRVIGTGFGSSSLETTHGDYWTSGTLSWDANPGSSPERDLLTPAFVPYVGRDTGVFRCPTDRYLSSVQSSRGWRSRVRSYSMNACFGPRSLDLFNLRQFERTTDVPRPAGYFVLVEEHPDSINDPTFFTSYGQPGGWVDLPASHHERSANFLFADAHVETHRWRSERTVLPVQFRFPILTTSPKDPDFLWAFERTSLTGQ